MFITLTIFLAACAGALLGGALSTAAGGMGGIRILNRRLTELEDDVALNGRRLTTEIKRRAGEARQPAMNVREELRELIAQSDVPIRSNPNNLGR